MAGLLSRVRERFLGAAAKPPRGVISGQVASGFSVTGGVPEIDYIDELGFPENLDVYREMANDAQVAKELRSNTLPLLTADWIVEPASDDTRDVLIAEFAGANLYHAPSDTFGPTFWIAQSWSDRLRDILRMLQNGFAIFHRSFRPEGRYQVIGSLTYLQPASILRWEFDELDRLVHIERQYVRADGQAVNAEIIQASELVVYTWDREGSNILGKPLIRPMFKPWTFKTKFEKLMMIDNQKKAVAVPFFDLGENATPAEEAAAETLLKLMRTGNLERLYATYRHGQNFGWKEGGPANKGMTDLIDGQNREIVKAGGMQFTELGLGQEGGSRGVAGAQGSFSGMLLTAISRLVAEQEQHMHVRPLVDANFAGVTAYPVVKATRIDPFEQTRNIPQFVEAITAGAVGADLDTENEIRKRYGFMERTSGPPPPGRAAAVQPGAPGEDGDEGDEGDGMTKGAPKGEDGKPEDGSDDDPENLSRAVFEGDEAARARVDAGRILSELERFEAVYLGTLRAVQSDMREAVVDALRAGELRPARPKEVKVPFQAELKERLAAIAKGVRDFGRQQLMAEIERQLHQLGRKYLVLANPGTRRGAISFSNEQAEVMVELDVSNLVARLQAQATEEFNRLVGTNATPAEIASRLQATFTDTSPRQIEDMARTSTSRSFNLGRNVSIQELSSQLQPEAVRVEVVDDNTCGPCKTSAARGGLNGLRAKIGSDSYFRNMPPFGCEGGDRCRGMWIVFPR